ncbi:hypothetical protein KP509_1Z280400 [Ceratopteris richardii]|nr:hypothetical protein KP509_1Z280400 [Ceratopteris richardii]
MLDHMHLKFKTESLKHDEVIPQLPKAIRCSIAKELFLSTVEEAYLFQGTSYEFLSQLVTEMKPEYFPPREDVILQNEAPTEFYIIVSGVISELYEGENGIEEIIRTAETGGVVGEMGVLCFKPQVFTVRTEKISQLLRIDRITFINIVQANVVDGEIIMDNLFQHMIASNNPRALILAKEIEEMFSFGKGVTNFSLRYAASVGNSELLTQILRKGLDPNTTDRRGRSPLHISAANGHLECVQILLDYGADPNLQDGDGTLALWQAIKGGHGLVARLLWECNASFVPNDAKSATTGVPDVMKELCQTRADDESTRTGRFASQSSTLESSIRLSTTLSLEQLDSLLNLSAVSPHPFEHKVNMQGNRSRPQKTTDCQEEKEIRISPKRRIERRLLSSAMSFENSLFRGPI